MGEEIKKKKKRPKLGKNLTNDEYSHYLTQKGIHVGPTGLASPKTPLRPPLPSSGRDFPLCSLPGIKRLAENSANTSGRGTGAAPCIPCNLQVIYFNFFKLLSFFFFLGLATALYNGLGTRLAGHDRAMPQRQHPPHPGILVSHMV